MRYPGGVISATPPTVNQREASGNWTLSQQMQYQGQGLWPPSQYEISRSLRFNSADSAYLNRTFGTATSVTIWTFSAWVKRGALGGTRQLFGASTNTSFGFNSSDQLNLTLNGSSAATSTAVFRDPSAWYHIVYQQNGSAQTIYVNNTSVATGTTAAAIFNTGISHQIGAANTTNYFNGYLTEINFVDGQALTPSDFGRTNPSTGVWEPLPYIGTYGTNGFYLNFSDNSGVTATTLGADSSGNGNNWTPNNFSVTAGAGNDSLVDTPTPYGTDTGVGGEVRGNYCTLNPLDKGSNGTLSNGNLKFVGSGSAFSLARSTIAFPKTGKWYMEFTYDLVPASAGFPMVGVYSSTFPFTSYSSSEGTISIRPKGSDNDYPYWIIDSDDASKRINTTAIVAGNIVQVIYDADNLKVWMGINNTYYGLSGGSTVTVNASDIASGTNPAYTLSASKTYFAGAVTYTTTDGSTCNFGQRPFAYTAPSGFKALCTQNLPTPTVVQGDDYFNTVLYTGTGSSQSITGVGFQPDWVWIKERSGAADHGLYDAVRGVQNQLESNTTTAETAEATGLTAFGSDGFTVGSLAQLNTNTDTYVAWNWNAGGSNATNTDGTITSTVRANTTAGFSIVSYTGNGVNNATAGHGLGVTPNMVILKNRSGTNSWRVYHLILGTSPTQTLYLNSTDGSTADLNIITGVNSSTMSLGISAGNASVNGSGNNYIAYCFAEIEGYSKFGSYTGNGSTDGPFVFANHKSAFVMIKRTDSTSNWTILDLKREGYNVDNDPLYPNLNNAEGTTDLADILSNGFKLRSTDASVNASGGTYIFMAFAENPFKYSLAR